MSNNDSTKLALLYRNRDDQVMGVRFPEGVEIFSLLCNTLASAEIQIFSYPVGAAASTCFTGIQLT
jgi:hypothetical protein